LEKLLTIYWFQSQNKQLKKFTFLNSNFFLAWSVHIYTKGFESFYPNEWVESYEVFCFVGKFANKKKHRICLAYWNIFTIVIETSQFHVNVISNLGFTLVFWLHLLFSKGRIWNFLWFNFFLISLIYFPTYCIKYIKYIKKSMMKTLALFWVWVFLSSFGPQNTPKF